MLTGFNFAEQTNVSHDVWYVVNFSIIWIKLLLIFGIVTFLRKHLDIGKKNFYILLQ